MEYKKIKKLFENGKISLLHVRFEYACGNLTKEQYKEITGQDYRPLPGSR